MRQRKEENGLFIINGKAVVEVERKWESILLDEQEKKGRFLDTALVISTQTGFALPITTFFKPHRYSGLGPHMR